MPLDLIENRAVETPCFSGGTVTTRHQIFTEMALTGVRLHDVEVVATMARTMGEIVAW